MPEHVAKNTQATPDTGPEERHRAKVCLRDKYGLELRADRCWYIQRENAHDQMVFKDAFFQKNDLVIILFRIYKLCFAKVNYFRRNIAKYEPCKYHYRDGFTSTELWDAEFLRHRYSGYIIDLRFLQSITRIEDFKRLTAELETFEEQQE